MKNFRSPFYVLCIVCTTLIIINFSLNNTLDKLQFKNKEILKENEKILNDYLELKAQHDLIFDEAIRLEEENQILGSMAAINETK